MSKNKEKVSRCDQCLLKSFLLFQPQTAANNKYRRLLLHPIILSSPLSFLSFCWRQRRSVSRLSAVSLWASVWASLLGRSCSRLSALLLELTERPGSVCWQSRAVPKGGRGGPHSAHSCLTPASAYQQQPQRQNVRHVTWDLQTPCARCNYMGGRTDLFIRPFKCPTPQTSAPSRQSCSSEDAGVPAARFLSVFPALFTDVC